MVGQEVHDAGAEVLVEAQILELEDQFVGDYCIECSTMVNVHHPDVCTWMLEVS